MLSMTWGSLLLLTAACTHKSDLQPDTNNFKLTLNSQLGTIITDGNGKTLYFFSLDANGQSACNGNCAIQWPPYYVATPDLPAGLTASDFSTITRTDGQSQTTYKGWPLYYYAKDSVKGDVKGEAVGTKWYTAKPDYSVLLAYTQLIGNDGKHYNSQYKEGDEVTPYLTDAYGRTLYAFNTDRLNTNKYTKPDFSNNPAWPIDSLNAVQEVLSTFNAGDFNKINVFGRNQLTFRGWPLYYFGADSAKRGNTKGVSVPTPGKWPIVNQNTVTAVP
jgi:predicted lipoprotein with Yx(FWY)xxD motif